MQAKQELKQERGTTGVFKKEKEGFNPFKMAQQQFDRIEPFGLACRVAGLLQAEGEGGWKRAAQQQAARLALAALLQSS